MKTVEYLNQLEDEVQSLLNGEVFSKCDYSTYDTLSEIFGVLFREIDELKNLYTNCKTWLGMTSNEIKED